jgi:CheY-like chemotaxis protein
MFDQYHYLYVEDDPLSREIMQITLREVMNAHSIVIFEDSINFMERLGALPILPDFILLDIHMEPHTGLELLQMIRSDEIYRDVKIIALTASVMNEEVAVLRISGFDGAIAKPVDISVFPDLIQRIIDGESIWHIA